MKPILFSAEMVRAILEGRKTQTRRVVKPQPTEGGLHWVTACGGDFAAWQDACLLLDEHSEDGGPCQRTCPYGKPGDTLWVREAFCAHWCEPPRDAPQSYRIVTGDELPPIKQENGDLYQPVPSDVMTVWYGAEGDKPFHMKWRPSIHMPRWASRITLRITDIRVERLQNIEGQHPSESDAIAEGVRAVHHGDGEYYYSAFRDEPNPKNWCDPADAFKELWNKINGPGAWEANPWVWVVAFERVKL
jgi:hypothetical protein